MGLTDPAPQEKIAFTFITAVIKTYTRSPTGAVMKTLTITSNP